MKETTPLLPTHHAIVKKNSYGHHAATAVKLGLSAVGLGAIFFYLGPATTCAQSETCGLWLSNAIGEKAAVILLTGGGVDFAGINAYFAFHSIDKFIDYIRVQPSTSAKVIKGSGIVLLAATQTLQSFFASTSTSTAAWETIASVSAVIAGSMYGATGMAEYEIRYLAKHVKQFATRCSRHMIDLCYPLEEPERQARNRLRNYQYMHDVFKQRVRTAWNQLVPEYTTTELDPTLSPLQFLLRHQTKVIRPASHLDVTINYLSKFIGTGLAGTYCSAFLLNSYRNLDQFSFLPRISLAVLLNLCGIYGSVALNVQGCKLMFGIPAAFFPSKSQDSFVQRSHPYLTSVAASLIVIQSLFSYAFINIMCENEIKETNRGYTANRILADMGIIIYHIAGMYKLYLLALEKLTRDKKEQTFFAIQREIQRVDRMMPEDFIKFVESNTDAENAQLGLYKIEDPTISHTIQAPEEAKPRSLCGLLTSWCGTWSADEEEEKLLAKEPVGRISVANIP